MTKEIPISLDLRGYHCPMPVIRLEAVLRTMAAGEQVKALADDPIADIDIPHFCREAGHRVEALPGGGDTGGEFSVFLVTKARDAICKTPDPA